MLFIPGILVEFGKQFQLGKDIIETISQEEYDNYLTKSLQVLRDLLNRGEFTNEGDIRAKEMEYERLSNPLTQFINTYYEPDINTKVAAWRVMDGYVAYCDEKGFRKPHSKNEFNDLLRINYDVEKKAAYDEETQETKNWVWVNGIKTKQKPKNEGDKKNDNLPVLPELPEVPLRPPIEKSYDSLGKLGKTGKNGNGSNDEKLPLSTILALPETGKTNNTPLTELTKQIIKAGELFTKSEGAINSTNIDKFSFWLCETYKPKWKSNGESGDYLPSSIKGIASRIFKLTPEAARA